MIQIDQETQELVRRSELRLTTSWRFPIHTTTQPHEAVFQLKVPATTQEVLKVADGLRAHFEDQGAPLSSIMFHFPSMAIFCATAYRIHPSDRDLLTEELDVDLRKVTPRDGKPAFFEAALKVCSEESKGAPERFQAASQNAVEALTSHL